MEEYIVESTSDLDQLISNNTDAVILFTGNKENGKSWCPDCNVADPVISETKTKLKSLKIVFITVFVGDLNTWKSSNNQFRSHPKFSINCVPTLINVSNKQRLEEGGCVDQILVEKLFLGTLEQSSVSKAGTCEDGVCRLR